MRDERIIKCKIAKKIFFGKEKLISEEKKKYLLSWLVDWVTPFLKKGWKSGVSGQKWVAKCFGFERIDLAHLNVRVHCAGRKGNATV